MPSPASSPVAPPAMAPKVAPAPAPVPASLTVSTVRVVTDHADSHNAAAPVPGKNSFTEAQARDRLEQHGYSAVSGLQLDNDQIWRGTATKDGRSVKVALDYQGNIVGQ